MAERYVYRVLHKYPYLRKVKVEFDWYSGFSVAQKRRSIASLHAEYARAYPRDRVLEISSKSPEAIGAACSAFNLRLSLGGREVSIECAYQASKVFEQGGPYAELLDGDSRSAKRDPRLRSSGRIVGFELLGTSYPTTPQDAFYSWLWANAVSQQPDLASQVVEYDAFTDIEFNPKRSIGCQAIAAARYVGLWREGRLDEALRDFEAFKSIAY